MYTLRPYQQQASDAGVRFFRGKNGYNAIEVLPTGSGKSLIVADIAHNIEGDTLILQPSKEILEQNYNKMRSYGEECSIYSASLRSKEISKITFATIGSVMNDINSFDHFRNIIIDECHRVNPNGGQYVDFINKCDRKVLGLTATPYILCSTSTPVKDKGGKPIKDIFGNCEMQRGAILKFLTRMRNRVFKDVIYYCQVLDLLKLGYLASPTYYDVTPQEFLQSRLKRNTTGMDFDTESVQSNFHAVGMYSHMVKVVRHLQNPKNKRKHILVFCQSLSEATGLTQAVPNCCLVSGETPMNQREQILQDFMAGKIHVLANVGVLTTGFDFPALDTVVMARPTMSLSLYYQIVGRLLRPYDGKDPWFIDTCGNIRRFGKVENLWLDCPQRGMWRIRGYVGGIWTQLTNIFF